MYIPIFIHQQEDILRLYVAMHVALVVAVLDSHRRHFEYPLDIHFIQLVVVPVYVVERVHAHPLRHDAHVVHLVHHVVDRQYVRMLQLL